MTTIFFCSEKPEKYTTEKWRHIFSQWYNAGVPFLGDKGIKNVTKAISKDDYNKYIKDQSFITREEWMMLWKALIFAKDENREINLQIADQIKGNTSPKSVRTLGRQIKGYDENVWTQWKVKVVINGNYLQFSQDDTMKKILLETEGREIVESAYYDAIWGIGLSEEKAKQTDRSKWGQNLLGRSIMQVRELIK